MTKKGYSEFQRKMSEQQLQGKIDQEGDIKVEYTKWTTEVMDVYQSQMISVSRTNRGKVDRILLRKIKELKKMKRQVPPDRREIIIARIKLIEEHIIEEMKRKQRYKIKQVMEAIKSNGKCDLQPYWEYIKQDKTTGQHRNIIIKNKEGAPMDNKKDTLTAFQNHYKELLQTKAAETQEEIEHEEHIEAAIRALKHVNKTTEAITREEDLIEVILSI